MYKKKPQKRDDLLLCFETKKQLKWRVGVMYVCMYVFCVYRLILTKPRPCLCLPWPRGEGLQDYTQTISFVGFEFGGSVLKLVLIYKGGFVFCWVNFMDTQQCGFLSNYLFDQISNLILLLHICFNYSFLFPLLT